MGARALPHSRTGGSVNPVGHVWLLGRDDCCSSGLRPVVEAVL